MPVVDEGGLLLLDAAQQRGQRLAGAQRDAHRQGVDEHADGGFDAGDLRRPVGEGGAEDDVVAAERVPEEHGPGALDDGVRGQAAGPGRGGDAGRELLVELVPQLSGQGARGPLAAVRRGEEGGLVQPLEVVAPRGAGGVLVASGEVGQVAAVGRCHGQAGVVAALPVEGEQLADEQGHRPAVHQQVVGGQHELVVLVAEGEQAHAQQRRGGGVEAPGAVGGDELLGAPLALGRVQAGEVLLLPRHGCVVGDELHRLVEVLLPESGAQVGVLSASGCVRRP
ncbi:hypothetical protein GCM10020000_76280 [Streptomyces olivoverticillatus]